MALARLALAQLDSENLALASPTLAILALANPELEGLVGLGGPQITLGGSLGSLGGPLGIPGGPQQELRGLWGLPGAPLETPVFTFWGGEIVNGITKYCHFRFGHDSGESPESAQRPSFFYDFQCSFFTNSEVNILEKTTKFEQL